MHRTVAEFLRTEAGGGVLLVLAALLSVVLANSPWAGSYWFCPEVG
jgi:NhaA family Na+:H+ antiporter